MWARFHEANRDLIPHPEAQTDFHPPKRHKTLSFALQDESPEDSKRHASRALNPKKMASAQASPHAATNYLEAGFPAKSRQRLNSVQTAASKSKVSSKNDLLGLDEQSSDEE